MRIGLKPIPTVIDDVAAARSVPPSGEVLLLRKWEHHTDQWSAYSQLLSRQLAHLYRRDVRANGGLKGGIYEVESLNGRVEWLSGTPSRQTLEAGAYRSIAMSYDVAARVLKRDGGEIYPMPLS